MTRYLHFINESIATTRNESLADGLGCGLVTQLWFNQLSHADGRRAFEVVNPDHESYLNQAERDALVDTLWYKSTLSGDIYVATNGTQDGDGSIGDPVNLATVCSALSTVAAGSTIHVLPGEYIGDFYFIHSGSSADEITIVFLAGARIKGSLTLNGDYLVVNDADIFDTPLTRWTNQTGSSPSDIDQKEGLTMYGESIILSHPKVQDVIGNGCGFWQPSINSVLYGLWAINNGWSAPDRGHGHGTYTQNEASGSKLLRNCIWAQGYSGGIRAYTTNQAMQAITIDKCISINDQLFLGGHSPASQCAITNNVVWNDQLEIGETDRDNQDITITGNYVVSWTGYGGSSITLRHWKTHTITGNTFVQRSATETWQIFPHASPLNVNINNNTYYVPNLATGFAIIYTDNGAGGYSSQILTIAQWQALGHDVNSTFTEGLPDANRIFVEHSEYNNDTAHVAIHNWESLSSVPVDFSGGNFILTNTYRAHNAMNPDEYHQFVYDGNSVSIPMTGWSRAIPSGDDEALTGDTWPDFLALVVKGV